jgi:hypothetical protein
METSEKGQHRQGVAAGVLLSVGIHPEQAVQPALRPGVPDRGEHGGQVVAERDVGQGQDRQQGGQGQQPRRGVAEAGSVCHQ